MLFGEQWRSAVAGTNLMSLDLSGRRGFGLYAFFHYVVKAMNAQYTK